MEITYVGGQQSLRHCIKHEDCSIKKVENHWARKQKDTFPRVVFHAVKTGTKGESSRMLFILPLSPYIRGGFREACFKLMTLIQHPLTEAGLPEIPRPLVHANQSQSSFFMEIQEGRRGGRLSQQGRERSPCYPLPRVSLPNLWDDSHFAAEEIEVIWFIHTL